MQDFYSITAYAPVIQQSENSFHERLFSLERPVYTLSVARGFDVASFQLEGTESYLIDWFKNGLARDIIWRGPDGFVCFNGWVERLSLAIGPVTRTKTLSNMGNRIIYVYNQLDTTANPPTAEGQQTITVNDTVSQTDFGIKMVTVSGGDATSTNANIDALSRLAKLSGPIVGEKQTIGGKAPSLQVTMRGYSYMADWYIYSQTAVSGTDDADNVILAVLTADPNSVLSSSTLNVDTNTSAIERYWESQPGWKVIDTIIKRGQTVGGNGVRWVGGIYEDRRLIYKAAEGLDSNGNPLSSNKHSIIYRSVADPGDIFTDESGKVLDYWQIRPDRLLATQGLPGDIAYIQKVTFNAPTNLQIIGDDDVGQPLAGLVKA
jgi:hypothetical protein